MAFTKRAEVGRALDYAEVDANWTELESIYAKTLEARDISVAESIIYPDTTAGLAATAEGGYFVVPDTATDELVFYREETGVAVEKVRIGYRLPFVGGTLTQALNFAPGVVLASAATVAIGAAASNVVTITGTTTITAFDSAGNGIVRLVQFAGSLTLTHSATLELPGSANITTNPGDWCVMMSIDSDTWRCISFHRVNGKSLIPRITTLRMPHTWAVAGEIKVPAGNADVIPGFFVPPLAAGQTVKLVSARHQIGAGTSVTAKLQRNGVDITGFTALSVTTTSTLTDPADVSLAAGDYVQLIVTAVSGTPQNLSFTLSLEYAAPGV